MVWMDCLFDMLVIVGVLLGLVVFNCCAAYWFNSVDYLNKIKIKLNCYLLFAGCYTGCYCGCLRCFVVFGDLLMVSGWLLVAIVVALCLMLWFGVVDYVYLLGSYWFWVVGCSLWFWAHPVVWFWLHDSGVFGGCVICFAVSLACCIE